MTVIDDCREWIEAALEYSGGFYEFEDIKSEIIAGNMQLWPAPHGCLVTQILDFPRKRVLHVFLGGGKLEQLAEMHSDVIAWAQAHGCDCATIAGRAGWERAFRDIGWTPIHRTLILDFGSWVASSAESKAQP